MDELTPVPASCPDCGGADFALDGGGLWDGRRQSGPFWKVRCRNCEAVWGAYPSEAEMADGQPLAWVRVTW